MHAQRQRDEQLAIDQRAAHKAKQLAFRRGLLEQMDIKRHSRQRLYAEFLQEKHRIDDIVQRFYDESVQELLAEQQKKREFRADLQHLRAQQAAWAQRQRRELELEDRRIAEFLGERNRRDDERRLADAAKLKSSSDMAERMGADLVAAEVSALR